MKDRLLGLARLLLILVGVGILVYPSLSEYLAEIHGSRTTAIRSASSNSNSWTSFWSKRRNTIGSWRSRAMA